MSVDVAECKKIAESEVAWAVWEAPLVTTSGRDFFVSIYFPPDQWLQMVARKDVCYELLRSKLEQAMLSLVDYIEEELKKEG